MIYAKRIVAGLKDFSTVTVSQIHQILNSEFKLPTRLSQDIKGLTGHGKVSVLLYDVTKLGQKYSRFFKNKNIEKVYLSSKGSSVVGYLLIDHNI